ncbi:MAG: hypothetical protein J0I20_09000 [Chloroflexi bacterium]|nr:hypothetical protein [Chloroflexota bacterium]OJV97010.1 MAG: hypothetical protein BGO39_18540 [Chloroflexi bacterium 54-19]
MGKSRTVLLVVLLAALLAGCADSSNTTARGAASVATPVPTIRTSIARDELAYPGAQWLLDKEVFPDGLPAGFENSLFGAFVTKDGLAQVRDFYQKRLVDLGLGYEPGYGCLQPGTCQKIYQLDGDIIECTADKNYCGTTYQFNFFLIDREAASQDDTNHVVPESFYTLAKMGQTFVIFGGGTYSPLVTPPANPTTAGVPDSKITTSVDK